MGIPTDSAGAVIGDGHSEHAHQAALITWARDSSRLQTDNAKRDALRWLHSIPNAAAGRAGFKTRSGHWLPPLQAVRMKAEGLTKGVLDLRLDYYQVRHGSAGAKHGIVGEMKKPGEKMSAEQAEYAAFAATQNLHVCLWFSWQQAATDIAKYMQLERFAPILIGTRAVTRYSDLP